MGATKENTADSTDAVGPPAWEAERVRSYLDRVGRVLDSDAASTEVPDPPDREQLLDDVLTAAFGPPWPAGVPERFREDPEALHGWARQLMDRRERQREQALLRIVRRFPSPVYAGRWHHIKDEALETLERAAESGPPWMDELPLLAGARLPDWRHDVLRRAGVGDALRDSLEGRRPAESRALVEAFCGALLGAVGVALSDPAVRRAGTEELETRLRSRVADALEEHLAPKAAAGTWRERGRPLDETGETEGDARQVEERTDQYRRMVERYDAALDIDRFREELTAEERRILEAVEESIREEGLRGGAPNVSDAFRRANVEYGERTFRRRWEALRERLSSAA